MRHTVLRAVVIPAIAIAMACGRSSRIADESPVLWDTDRNLRRTIQAVAWDTLWSIGSANDTLVFGITHMQPLHDGLVLFDPHAKTLVALDQNGNIRWTLGRRGAGPSEFEGARDLKADADGNLLLNDPRNGRITVISPGGVTLDHIPTTMHPHAEVMVPLVDGRIVLVTAARTEPVRVISRDGRELARADLAWSEFATMSMIAKQGITVADGDRWAYLFSLGDGWFAHNDLEPAAYIGRYQEHTDFPALVVSESRSSRSVGMLKQSPCSACGASLFGDTLFVHFGGYTDDQYGIVDLYDWSTGNYILSRRLPGKVQSVAVRGNRYYLQSDYPHPRVLALALRTPDQLPTDEQR